jgi:hypothetical protein
MVKEIPVGRGFVALVDDDWYDMLSLVKWAPHKACSSKSRHANTHYAQRCMRLKGGKTKTEVMHRMILDAPKGVFVDHINGNGLDNQVANLRLCTNGQNMANRKKNRNTSSRFKGVTWMPRLRKWQAQIFANKVPMYLGCYETEEEAAKVYNRHAIVHFGPFARLNEVPHD